MVFGFDGGAFILLSVVLFSGLITFLFYRRDNLRRVLNKRSFFVLSLLRYLVLLVCLVLFLNPFLSGSNKIVNQPQIAVLFDNSQSIANGGVDFDSASKILSRFDVVQKELEGTATLKKYVFDKELKPADSLSLTGGGTNAESALNDLYNYHQEGQLSAVVLFSDGVFNSGSKVLNKNKLGADYYVIGLGDTSVVKDAVVDDIFHSSAVVLGNSFLVRTEGVFYGLRGEQIKVSLFYDGELKEDKEFVVVKNNEFFAVEHKIKADSIGLHKIVVKCQSFYGEKIVENNTKISYVEVKSKKQKLVFVSDGPHPDVSAIKSCFAEDKNFELKTISFSELNKAETEVDLLVMFGTPILSKDKLQFEVVMSQYKGAVFFVTTSVSDLRFFEDFGFSVSQDNKRINESGVFVNNSFNYFKLNDEERDFLKSCPPLFVPYGEYVVSTSYKPLLFQKIQGLETDFPLLSLSQNDKNRIAWLSGEGVWRWRLNELKNSNEDIAVNFSSFFKKIFDNLITHELDKNARIQYKKIYSQEEEVVVSYEMFDKATEVLGDSVVFRLLDKKGQSLVYQMINKGGVYEKYLGRLSPGEYEFDLKYQFSGKKTIRKGQFVVVESSVEQRNLQADFDQLRLVANGLGGQFYTVDKIDDVLNEIIAKDYKQQSYFENFTERFLDKSWLLFLIIGLVSFEWFIRKWNGTV